MLNEISTHRGARHHRMLGAALVSAGMVSLAWMADARSRNRKRRSVHRTLIDVLLNALTADDAMTARHSRRVADLTYVVAAAMGMRGAALATARVAALLHDMGKIDDRFFDIVHSHKPLTPEQRAEIEHHPHESAHILGPLEKLHPGIRQIVSSHHECWNGSGYPVGLGGQDIPLSARIIAVADVFDALTQPRKYRDPMPMEDALEELHRGAGTQFDPAVVQLLLSPAIAARWGAIARAGQQDEERVREGEQDEKRTGFKGQGE
ncbi:MAG TPA: HD domain-containing phosphohydrolase [Longimicrobiaceae bacterium]|jgi:putative nucleotidyltransferase with HDIG domain|nr:HD domain-containing phosphohydrolase [Longimicrobiaceae bacterium]